jgi:HlyD family secretion protein
MANDPRTRRSGGRTFLRWVKRLAWIAVALGLVAVIVVSFLPKPVPVDVVTARRGTLRVTVDEDGRTRVMDRYELSAPLTGTLARIELAPGDRVTAGQVVARLVPLARPLMDPATRAETEARVAAAQATRRQAQASIQRARAAVTYAEQQAERARQLAQRGSLPQDSLDRAELELRSRREELTSAEFGARVAAHQLEMAEAALGRVGRETTVDAEQFELTSPIEGVVLRVLHESGGAVQLGTPLLVLGDPAHLEIATDVLTTDAIDIEPGDRVTIERWGGPTDLAGHVRLVEPSAFTRTSALGVEEQRVNVVIDLDSPREQWERLGDGYRVETRIVIWEEADVLVVPASSVFRQGEGWGVYRVREGRAVLTPVRTGRRNGLLVQIVEGLSEGDTLVAHPSDRVVDGAEVQAR